MYEYEVVSADAHIEAPPTRWTDRLPAALRDRRQRSSRCPTGPRRRTRRRTGATWADHHRWPYLRPVPPEGPPLRRRPPGTGQPAQRIAEQDRDGVDAEVLFSTVIATMFTKMQDRS